MRIVLIIQILSFTILNIRISEKDGPVPRTLPYLRCHSGKQFCLAQRHIHHSAAMHTIPNILRYPSIESLHIIVLLHTM